MNKLKVLCGLFSLLLVFFGISGTIFGQLDVPRRTTAITYPLDERVTVQFRGTTRFPRMGGRANIRRTARNGTEIQLSVFKMPRPFELGAGYATYVLWAVSPNGQVDNLGEIKRRGFFEFDSNIRVTTRLQTFALLITAEPHYLVTRPSQEIMLENLNGSARSGRALESTAAVQYFGNSSDFFRDARTPEIAEIDYSKTPSTVLQARQAIALARYAGAGRDATEEFQEAETLLNNADEAWRAGRREADVDVTARQAIGAAVKAESLAVSRGTARQARNEQSRTDSEMRTLEDRLQQAQNEIAQLKQELAGETRNRELSERDVANYTQQIRDLRAENTRLSEELGRERVEARSLQARLADFESREQQEVRAQRITQIEASEPELMRSLRKFGTVAKNDRGVVLTLPETFWATPRESRFSPNSDPTLNELATILANNPDYHITIESHTDDGGEPDALNALTRQRSTIIADRLQSFGIENRRIEAKGLGAAIPVAPNTTNANRARNRRVQLIMVPAI